MATYDLEEQDQLAEIKTWWKQYGNQLINVLLVAALIAAGWQGWNWYQRRQTGQAAQVYSVLTRAIADKDTQRVKAASGELLEKFGSTGYASLGALSTAKAMLDNDDAKTAKLQLQWVVEHGDDELRDVARLRLVDLLLDEKAYAEALKQLDGKVSAGFETRFADTRGDVLAAQGETEKAVAAYQGALAKLDETGDKGKTNAPNWQLQSSGIYREVLQQKLDALGGAK